MMDSVITNRAKKVRKFLETIGISRDSFLDVLKELRISYISAQCEYLLDTILKLYSPDILKQFFLYVNDKHNKGILLFGKKNRLEEFYIVLQKFAESVTPCLSGEKVTVPLTALECPKCKSSIKKGQPRCLKCKIILEWVK